MSLEGRIALVTGASRGLGHACALAYARAGAKIVATARTVGGLEELDDEVRALGGEAVLVPLDLRDGPGIDRLGPALAERFGRLDILLGCAGTLGTQTPVAHMKDEAWSDTLALNLGANWRLLRSLDGLLRASEGGRALFLTCEAATSAPPYLSAYAASKAGLAALVRSYAGEVRHAGVAACLVDPGPARTHLRARYLPGEDRDALPKPDDFAGRIVGITQEASDHSGETWQHADGGWSGSRER